VCLQPSTKHTHLVWKSQQFDLLLQKEFKSALSFYLIVVIVRWFRQSEELIINYYKLNVALFLHIRCILKNNEGRDIYNNKKEGRYKSKVHF